MSQLLSQEGVLSAKDSGISLLNVLTYKWLPLSRKMKPWNKMLKKELNLTVCEKMRKNLLCLTMRLP